MAFDTMQNSRAAQREAMYSFGGYNPYYPSEKDIPLVQENLARLQSGELSLRSFLRQTPQFPRWRADHAREAQVLLLTNEAGLEGTERLYADMVSAQGVSEVAARYQRAMLSWLGLSDHPRLNAINGETSWQEGGPWQAEYPALAGCGKLGYFITADEEARFAGVKVLHLELSAFAQDDSQDVNPRNDLDTDYHRENIETVERFCSSQHPGAGPRYIFIVGNRACIRRADNDSYRLKAIKTVKKDKSLKILDLLRVVDWHAGHIEVRLCQQRPVKGRQVKVFTALAASAGDVEELSWD